MRVVPMNAAHRALMLAGICAAALHLGTAPALGQQSVQRIPVRDILLRIDRLESEVAKIRLAPPSALGEDGLSRVEQIEVELRRLTGLVERLEYESAQRATRAERRMLDLETRLEALESQDPSRVAIQPAPAPVPQAVAPLVPRAPEPVIAPMVNLQPPASRDSDPDLGALPGRGVLAPQDRTAQLPQPGTTQFSTLPPQPETVPPQVYLAPSTIAPQQAAGNPGEAYRAALQLLNEGRFEDAGVAFERIAESYGNDPAVGQSKYWLGDMHLRMGRYDLAAKSFLEAFRGWPSGPKAPDSLLKLGITLANLGQINEACLTFTQFASRYPDASPVLLRRAEIEAQRAQCGA